jgi:hypothetical protein
MLRMTLALLSTTTARVAIGLLVVAGLALGRGAHPAAADEIIRAPTLLSLHLEAPEATVTFKDNADPDYGLYITLRERDHPDRIAVSTFTPGGVPGVGRVATRTIRGITPGVAYCATVQAIVRVDNFNDDLYGLEDPVTDESNAICMDPTSPQPPDLVLEKVGGPEETEWSAVAGKSPAYLVVFRNTGADATGTVVVDISTSGVATLAPDQAAVRAGWAAAGFTCVSTPPTGGANAGLRCTGGSLKQGENTNPAILVRFTGRGYGHIHASVSVRGGAETDTRDNAQTFNVRVY